MGIGSQATWQKDVDALSQAAVRVLGCIANSSRRCPPSIRQLCCELRERLVARTGQPTLARQIIAQALLTRCISPALASPQSYDLVTYPPSEPARRALVVLSYIVRHLGAGTTFNVAKDPTTILFNELLRSHSDIISDFVDRIASSLDSFPADASTEFTLDAAGANRALLEFRAFLVNDTLEQLCVQIGGRKTEVSPQRRQPELEFAPYSRLSRRP